MPSPLRRIVLPLVAGVAGMAVISGLYFGIVSLAESPRHAIDLFLEERWFVVPLIVGFGVQSALYVIIKKRLFVPVGSAGPSDAMMGAGGATSTMAMVACCAHHVTDVLPILGLTAAATFLAEYQRLFMIVGLTTTAVGIGVMSWILARERRRSMALLRSSWTPEEAL